MAPTVEVDRFDSAFGAQSGGDLFRPSHKNHGQKKPYQKGPPSRRLNIGGRSGWRPSLARLEAIAIGFLNVF